MNDGRPDGLAADHAIAKAKKHPNFIAEITLTSVPCGVIDYLVEGCGADRVVYGSDQPMPFTPPPDRTTSARRFVVAVMGPA